MEKPLGIIEQRLDANQIFHKPRNHGFIAFGDERIYVVRDKDELELVEIPRCSVESLRVGGTEAYDSKYNRSDAEPASTDEPLTEIMLTLPSNSEVVTVKAKPRQVMLQLLECEVTISAASEET
jgi:hypothetical protein